MFKCFGGEKATKVSTGCWNALAKDAQEAAVETARSLDVLVVFITDPVYLRPYDKDVIQCLHEIGQMLTSDSKFVTRFNTEDKKKCVQDFFDQLFPLMVKDNTLYTNMKCCVRLPAFQMGQLPSRIYKNKVLLACLEKLSTENVAEKAQAMTLNLLQKLLPKMIQKYAPKYYSFQWKGRMYFASYKVRALAEGNQVVGVFLDEAGDTLSASRTSYNVQPGQSLRDAMEIVYHRMVEKFKAYNEEKTTETTHLPSEAWDDLTQTEKFSLISESHSPQKAQEAALTYFQNHALPYLDIHGFHQSLMEKSEFLKLRYWDVLNGKHYKNAQNKLDGSSHIDQFLTELAVELEPNWSKAACHKRVLECVLDLGPKIETNPRFFTLLETEIQSEAGRMPVLLEKITSNATLMNNLQSLHQEKAYQEAQDMLQFLLLEHVGSEIQSKCQVNVHIQNINTILKNWSVCDSTIPFLQFPLYDVGKYMQTELCKELDWKIRTRFAAVAMELTPASWFAAAALTMMVIGARVEELCAIQFRDIKDNGDWGVCMIYRTAQNGICVEDGKNEHFRRTVFFPKVVMDAIHRRTDYLTRTGVTAEQLENAFLCCNKDDIYTPATQGAFAREAKKLLQFGNETESKDFWDSVQYAMEVEPYFDKWNNKEKYDVAYVLRRDATSMMCNVAKMPPLLVDAILGHRLPNHAKPYEKHIRRVDNWPTIIAQMERVVYLENHSNNPWLAPVPLVIGQAPTPSLVPYQGHTFTADTPCRITLLVVPIGVSNLEVRTDLTTEIASSCTENLTPPNDPFLFSLRDENTYKKTEKQALKDYFSKK